MSSYLLQILKNKGLILLRDWVLLTPPSPPPPSMLLRGEHTVNGVHLFMVPLRERERERENKHYYGDHDSFSSIAWWWQ